MAGRARRLRNRAAASMGTRVMREVVPSMRCDAAPPRHYRAPSPLRGRPPPRRGHPWHTDALATLLYICHRHRKRVRISPRASPHATPPPRPPAPTQPRPPSTPPPPSRHLLITRSARAHAATQPLPPPPPPHPPPPTTTTPVPAVAHSVSTSRSSCPQATSLPSPPVGFNRALEHRAAAGHPLKSPMSRRCAAAHCYTVGLCPRRPWSWYWCCWCAPSPCTSIAHSHTACVSKQGRGASWPTRVTMRSVGAQRCYALCGRNYAHSIGARP
jgi:hypothetical protein